MSGTGLKSFTYFISKQHTTLTKQSTLTSLQFTKQRLRQVKQFVQKHTTPVSRRDRLTPTPKVTTAWGCSFHSPSTPTLPTSQYSEGESGGVFFFFWHMPFFSSERMSLTLPENRPGSRSNNDRSQTGCWPPEKIWLKTTEWGWNWTSEVQAQLQHLNSHLNLLSLRKPVSHLERGDNT